MSVDRKILLYFLPLIILLYSCESQSPDRIRDPENFKVKIKGLTPNGPIDYDLEVVESLNELGDETIRLVHYCQNIPDDERCSYVLVELAIPARLTDADEEIYVAINIENKVNDTEHVWNINDTYNSAWRGSLGTTLKYSVVSFRYKGTNYSSENLLPAIGTLTVFSDKKRLSGNFSFKLRTNDNIGYTMDISGNFDAVIADDVAL